MLSLPQPIICWEEIAALKRLNTRDRKETGDGFCYQNTSAPIVTGCVLYLMSIRQHAFKCIATAVVRQRSRIAGGGSGRPRECLDRRHEQRWEARSCRRVGTGAFDNGHRGQRQWTIWRGAQQHNRARCSG